MARATNHRSRPHARIFHHWLGLPTWRCLSPDARSLLVEMLAEYRPGTNGNLVWPCRRVADALGVSKATASRALTSLERNGWIKVTKVTKFGGSPKPANYSLTTYLNDFTGEPATCDFENLPGEAMEKRRSRREKNH